VLDPAAASLVDTKHDTVYVIDQHPVYQVPGKKLYIAIRFVPQNEVPDCAGFVPFIYQHIKVISVSEMPCE
jgi:hypothetical protein